MRARSRSLSLRHVTVAVLLLLCALVACLVLVATVQNSYLAEQISAEPNYPSGDHSLLSRQRLLSRFGPQGEDIISFEPYRDGNHELYIAPLVARVVDTFVAPFLASLPPAQWSRLSSSSSAVNVSSSLGVARSALDEISCFVHLLSSYGPCASYSFSRAVVERNRVPNGVESVDSPLPRSATTWSTLTARVESCLGALVPNLAAMEKLLLDLRGSAPQRSGMTTGAVCTLLRAAEEAERSQPTGGDADPAGREKSSASSLPNFLIDRSSTEAAPRRNVRRSEAAPPLRRSYVPDVVPEHPYWHDEGTCGHVFILDMGVSDLLFRSASPIVRGGRRQSAELSTQLMTSEIDRSTSQNLLDTRRAQRAAMQQQKQWRHGLRMLRHPAHSDSFKPFDVAPLAASAPWWRQITNTTRKSVCKGNHNIHDHNNEDQPCHGSSPEAAAATAHYEALRHKSLLEHSHFVFLDSWKDVDNPTQLHIRGDASLRLNHSETFSAADVDGEADNFVDSLNLATLWAARRWSRAVGPSSLQKRVEQDKDSGGDGGGVRDDGGGMDRICSLSTPHDMTSVVCHAEVFAADDAKRRQRQRHQDAQTHGRGNQHQGFTNSGNVGQHGIAVTVQTNSDGFSGASSEGENNRRTTLDRHLNGVAAVRNSSTSLFDSDTSLSSSMLELAAVTSTAHPLQQLDLRVPFALAAGAIPLFRDFHRQVHSAYVHPNCDICLPTVPDSVIRRVHELPGLTFSSVSGQPSIRWPEFVRSSYVQLLSDFRSHARRFMTCRTHASTLLRELDKRVARDNSEGGGGGGGEGSGKTYRNATRERVQEAHEESDHNHPTMRRAFTTVSLLSTSASAAATTGAHTNEDEQTGAAATGTHCSTALFCILDGLLSLREEERIVVLVDAHIMACRTEAPWVAALYPRVLDTKRIKIQRLLGGEVVRLQRRASRESSVPRPANEVQKPTQGTRVTDGSPKGARQNIVPAAPHFGLLVTSRIDATELVHLGHRLQVHQSLVSAIAATSFLNAEQSGRQTILPSLGAAVVATIYTGGVPMDSPPFRTFCTSLKRMLLSVLSSSTESTNLATLSSDSGLSSPPQSITKPDLLMFRTRNVRLRSSRFFWELVLPKHSRRGWNPKTAEVDDNFVLTEIRRVVDQLRNNGELHPSCRVDFQWPCESRRSPSRDVASTTLPTRQGSPVVCSWGRASSCTTSEVAKVMEAAHQVFAQQQHRWQRRNQTQESFASPPPPQLSPNPPTTDDGEIAHRKEAERVAAAELKLRQQRANATELELVPLASEATAHGIGDFSLVSSSASLPAYSFRMMRPKSIATKALQLIQGVSGCKARWDIRRDRRADSMTVVSRGPIASSTKSGHQAITIFLLGCRSVREANEARLVFLNSVRY